MALLKNRNRDTAAGEKARAKSSGELWTARGSNNAGSGNNVRKSVAVKGQRKQTLRAAARS